uniref:Acetoacetyl-CoA synthetase n=1 Tax=Ditylenchus dipsaci TaxID=166011 RepID=A0A915DZZ8_9BILA
MNGHLADHKFYVPNENEDNAEKRLMRYIQNTFNVNFGSYEEWYKWTITNYALFWEAVLKQCDIKLSSPYHKIVEEDVPIAKIPKWFQGARLNYAENCLKNGVDGHIAFIQANSPTEMHFYDYASLRQDVHRLASVMRLKFNVKSGDVVCAYVSNRYETAVAMLATTSLGAVWSSASVDFGAIGVIDRFSQLSPKLFFTSDFAVYKKKIHSLEENINEIVEGLPTLEKVIVIPNTSTNIPTAYTQANKFCTFQETMNLFQSLADATVYFEQVAFDHPLFVMFSSGTTGPPKGMIHTVGGTLLKHAEEHIIQANINPNDTILFYTTCGWMMWNWLLTVLFTGATIVLFDECPLDPDPHILLKIVQNTKSTILGSGAKVFDEYTKMGSNFKSIYNLSSLRLLLSTASPLKTSTFDFLNDHIKPEVVIGSICGGTDIIGCFMGATLNRPVVPGECQHFYLGMNCSTFNEQGIEVQDTREN